METVKKSEKDSSLVLRFYEYGNRRSTVEVELVAELSSVEECNLMEEECQAVPFTGKTFSFDIDPYEIKTFKIR